MDRAGEPAVVAEGYFYKRGQINTAYKRRYFRLLRTRSNTFTLQYYAKKDSPAKGAISLQDMETIDLSGAEFALRPAEQSEGGRGSMMMASFDMSNKRRTYRFRADDDDGKRRWLRLLSPSPTQRALMYPQIPPMTAAETMCRNGLKAIECPVCLDCWGADDANRVPTTLPCGHSLCMAHLPHLNKCPVCRADVPPNFDPKPSYGMMAMASQVNCLCSLLQHEGGMPEAACPASAEATPRAASPASAVEQNEMPAPSLVDAGVEGTQRVSLQHEEATSGATRPVAAVGLNQTPAPSPVGSEVEGTRRSQAPGERAPTNDSTTSSSVDDNADNAIPLAHLIDGWQSRGVHRSARNPNATMKQCGCFCELSHPGSCCEHADRRPRATGYPQYMDGIGHRLTATRHQHYCPTCRERLSRTAS